VVHVVRRGCARLRQRLLTYGDLGVEASRRAVAVGDGIVELSLGICEKVRRRSCFGAGAGHTGDMRLRTGRRRIELTARDDESFVTLAVGVVDRGVECGACLPGAVEFRRSLRNGGSGVCAASGALVEDAVDPAGEHYDRSEFADHHADGDRDAGPSDDARPAPCRAAGDAPAHRADQQAEHERQRHDDRDRHVRRFGDRECGDEPGQRRTEQHHNAGDHMRGPLVALIQFTPLAAAEPAQRFSNSVGRHGNSKHLLDLSQRDRGAGQLMSAK
jgi:hypothetical protein